MSLNEINRNLEEQFAAWRSEGREVSNDRTRREEGEQVLPLQPKRLKRLLRRVRRTLDAS